ncbi:MAG: chalcone isomerase family protein [Burkholderiaceae bacterium]|nr:chalcone isomerase family protein [Burkholderiaceae bacterium]
MNLGIRLGRALLAFGAVATLTASIFTAPAASAATEIAGFKFDDTTKVNGQDLKLNGAGIRYKFVVKVYAAGLYIADKKTTTADVIAEPGAKRITLIMLREVGSETMGQAFIDGIKKNSDIAERSKIVNQMLTFGNLFGSIPELNKGDVVTTDWIPGSGTVVSVNGKKLTDPIPDIAFYNALLKIWLGDRPADSKLKSAMLGDAS